MSRQVVFRPEAREEMLDAFAWYERQRDGLGDGMLACVDAAIHAARRTPELGPRVQGDVRRVLVRRFPYAIFYLTEPDRIVILAIAHVRREPGYWLSRG